MYRTAIGYTRSQQFEKTLAAWALTPGEGLGSTYLQDREEQLTVEIPPRAHSWSAFNTGLPLLGFQRSPLPRPLNRGR